MKKERILKSLLSAWVMMLLVIAVTSCDDDDDDINSGQVVLLSFGPSGVHLGDEIVFVGENLSKVSAVVFQPGVEVSKSAFTSATDERIKLVIPQSAETGKVVLKTADGDVESKTVFSLEVPVVISAVTDEAKPGTDITITGEFVNWIESITFPSDVTIPKVNFVSRSQTEVVVTVPLEAETGFLIFNTGGTEPLAIGYEDPLTVTLPAVLTLNPLSVQQTENITISGTDLDLITEITFGGDVTSSEFVSQSENEIVLSVPVGALTGALTLHQVSPVSITTSDELSIVLPKGTNLAPKPAIPGTDNITITGTNLDLVSELTLVGATDPIVVPVDQFVSISATEIVLDLPETAANGPIVYKSIHGYSSNLGVSVLIPTPGPAPLDYYIYDDGLLNGWSKWNGWGTDEQDFASTEEVFDGTQAIKIIYNDQWGAVQVGAPSTDVFSGYSTLSFRIFVPEAQDFIIQLNEDGDNYLSVPAGWSEVEIAIADMAGNDNVAELRFKNNNANTPVTLYIDYIGLKL